VRRRYNVLPEQVRRQIIGLAAQGVHKAEIVRRLDASDGTVNNVLKPLGGVIRPELAAPPSPARLSVDDRVEILRGLERGWSYARIGASLAVPRHRSTVLREVTRGGGRDAYQPLGSHRRACAAARRPRPGKLADPRLRARVERDLRQLWSPRQIAARLTAEFGDDASMTVSHETIYRALYVQGRGELRRELTRCLRTGRAVRKRRRSTPERRGGIPDKVMISERPAEAADRAVPGHWEGDLILGKNAKSAVGTLVERTSRFVLLLHLPQGRGAEAVRDAMTTAITTLPEALRRSVTWDQGVEMAQHVRFTVESGVPVYFCDPHSPWQRGSNENTNGLLRQYMPKGTDLSVLTADDLQAIADSLNTRPRQTLNWMTPSEKLAQLVASTG
jgi:transposase, IS30 family